MLFTPAYSSPFNCQEYVWAQFKARWAKAIASITCNYDMASMERDIELVMHEVGQTLTPAILTANACHMVRCMQGILV